MGKLRTKKVQSNPVKVNNHWCGGSAVLCNGSLESLQSALECIVLSVPCALYNVSEVIMVM